MKAMTLKTSILPASASTLLDRLLSSEINGEWGRNVHFWQHCSTSQTEPDIVIELEQVVILIEVKFNSKLSGNDQLIREAELLTRNYPGKEKILILLAREESALTIFNDQKSNIPADISFGYITWQRLFDIFDKNKANSLICGDLAELLDEKGFGGFRGFNGMNEETIRAFRTVHEVHQNVQEFISHCIALANQKGEFEVAPMTGNNTFLRWNSDRDSNAWSYSDFIVIFQRCCDTYVLRRD